jgi:hypothetical protein
MFQDKLTKSIAEAAAQIKTEAPKNIVNGNSVEGAVVSIMANEELKGKQHKIDANKNGKIDAQDFKLLRKEEGSADLPYRDVKGRRKREDDEGYDRSVKESRIGNTVKKSSSAVKKVFTREELESVQEAFPTVADAKKRMSAGQSSFEKKKVSTGTVYSRKYREEPDVSDDMPKKKAKTMKEMLDIYKNHGAESLVENLMIEEPSQDEYKKETEIAQAKSEGKIRNDKGIAKPATQGVKMEEVEIELLDADEINGVQIDNIEERSMTDAEMDKREEIVKSMKKGIQGFKDRYGDDAKSVMYATATKLSKKD